MNLDIIAIGAINYDYIFSCKIPQANKIQTNEPGGEHWENNIRESLYSNINTLKYSSVEYNTQIGGSAFLALKSANSVDSKLRISYVGVCGLPTDNEINFGFSKERKEEFNFLNNKDWLFFDNSPPGLSVVKLNIKNERDDINIDPGANNKLQQYIIDKEKETGQSFVDFLCSTRWIHISSLADFNQFIFILEMIKKAKEKNPLIRLSIDPGYQYVKNRKSELHAAFAVADYVFLSENELRMLVGDESLSSKILTQDITAIFNYYKPSNSQVLVIKKANKIEMYSFTNGNLHLATFWNKNLQINKILNDTGAGDAFAGGFIAACLSSQYIVHQPFPIEMGMVAAAARLKCKGDPTRQIQIDAEKFTKLLQKEEEINGKQRWRKIKQAIGEHFSVYVTGIATGLIVWVIQLFITFFM